MNEKLMIIKDKLIVAKDKVVEVAKKVFHYFKTNMVATAILMFGIVAFVLILVAMLALNEFVVPVCVLILLEAGMAALLHKAELWKHGVLLALQFVAAIIIGRIPIVIVCMLAYVAATFALQLMARDQSVKVETTVSKTVNKNEKTVVSPKE